MTEKHIELLRHTINNIRIDCNTMLAILSGPTKKAETITETAAVVKDETTVVTGSLSTADYPE